MTRRAERRASRREEVLVAAMKLVAEEGLDALTIQRIAGAINASVGGLYRYYEGKDALLSALQRRAIAAVAEDQARDVEMARTLFARGGEPAGVVALAAALVGATVMLRHAIRRPEEHRLLDAFLTTPEPILSDESAKASESDLQPLVKLVASELEAATADGTLERGDAAQRTHMMWASLHGLDHFRKRDRLLPEALRVEALVPATLIALTRGWGANAAKASRAAALLATFEAHDAATAPAPASGTREIS
jgi:AcrR family transcriptional regulator